MKAYFQRAVLNKDLFRIPEIIGNPDEVEESGFYNKFPVIKFKKDGITIVAVVSEGVLDLYTQAMYISKKIEALLPKYKESNRIFQNSETLQNNMLLL